MNARVNTSIVNRLYGEINKKSKNNGARRKITLIDKIIISILIAIFLLFAAGAIYYHNEFVYLTDSVETSLAQIDVRIQKRKNLIINLEKTVLDYSKHERQIFTILAELRRDMRRIIPAEVLKDAQNNIPDVQSLAGMGKNTAKLSEKLSKLIAVAEKSPDLKLNDNFKVLMNAIIEVENKIAESRMKYNNSLKELTKTTGEFPGNIFAVIFEYKFKDFKFNYFKLHEDENNFMKVNY